jgi:hypothetical protein
MNQRTKLWSFGGEPTLRQLRWTIYSKLPSLRL